MKVKFICTESGIDSANVAFADAATHIAARDQFADEANALIAFAALDDIPNSFVDSDGDKWRKVGEFSGDGDHYIYEYCPSCFRADLNDGGKSAEFDSMEAALAYIAKNFQTEADELGTAEIDGTDETHVWMTQDDADDAQDGSDVIAVITKI
jgi:hypothetical protein